MSKITTWLENNISLHKNDTPAKEWWNSKTHAVGAILSFIALIAMLVKVSSNDNSLLFIGVIVYGLSMVLLYSASSLYHHLPHSNAKRVMRIMDHANIYFLIAGTYTSICFYMNSRTGYTILLIEWLCAIFGIFFTIKFWGKLKPLHVVIYLLMGWVVVFFWREVSVSVPREIIPYMFAGGITYSIGVIFYGIKKIPNYHAIWHTFVVGGSFFFFLGIYKYLI